MSQTTLVIGGTKGLGYELAKHFTQTGPVIVTGRTEPVHQEGISWVRHDLNDTTSVQALVSDLPKIDTLVIAAGYLQSGELAKLSAEEVVTMVTVGLTAPTLILRALLAKQEYLPGLLTITSTSQWTPRRNEPVYTAIKGGIEMLSYSLSKDPAVGRVLVAAPSGMKTEFWSGVGNDVSEFLEPGFVSETIYKDWTENTENKFREIGILRQPTRIEIRKVD
jgi:NAD(P)-dependent dehydrogenase (short-subunit alcohol dehydrogenase family)